MGEVGAGQYDYLELQQLQTAVSGGLGMGASLRSQVNDKNQISAWLTLTTKSLVSNFDSIALLKLAFEQLVFDEKDRIVELLQQRKTRWASTYFQVQATVMPCKLRDVTTVLWQNVIITTRA